MDCPVIAPSTELLRCAGLVPRGDQCGSLETGTMQRSYAVIERMAANKVTAVHANPFSLLKATACSAPCLTSQGADFFHDGFPDRRRS
jgi:hypothetical protein